MGLASNPIDDDAIPPGEAEATRRISEISVETIDLARKPVPRDQHPKSHGLLTAEFVVEPGLPDAIRFGVFREPRTFPTLIRTSNGREYDDRKPDIHGFALKLLGVEGPKVLESEADATTQDFLLIDYHVFFIKDAMTYVPFAEAVLWAKKSIVGRLVLILKILFSQNPTYQLLRRATRDRPDSPLRISYWGTTPVALGPKAMKFTLRPVLDDMPAPPPRDSADKLTEAIRFQLARGDARFDFLVQLRTDPASMPIEDPTVDWDEAKFPPIKAATLRIPAGQPFDSPERLKICENLSFTPWHAIEDHRPLGGINRVRRLAYELVSRKRHQLNGEAESEPTVELFERLSRETAGASTPA